MNLKLSSNIKQRLSMTFIILVCMCLATQPILLAESPRPFGKSNAEDQPPQSEAKGLVVTLRIEPAELVAGGQAALLVSVTNPQAEAIEGWTLAVRLEGLSLRGGEGKLALEKLGAGESREYVLPVMVTTEAGGYGAAWVDALDAQGKLVASANSQVAVRAANESGPEPVAPAVWPLAANMSEPEPVALPQMQKLGQLEAAGGQLVSPDGRVTVVAPAGAVGQSVELSYGVVSAEPLNGETGTVLEFELGAQSGGQAVDNFDQPVEVKLNLKGLVDLGKRAPQTWLRFELEGEPPLPVQANPDEQSVSAKIGRPGRIILSITPGAPGVWALQYEPPSAALFNGQLGYQVPINVPAGRNGLQPALSLSYGSGRLLGRTGSGYESRGSGPIGDAWSLDGLMTIARERWYECYTKNSSGEYTYYTCFDDIFVLTINGTGYELTPVPAPPAQGQTTGRYYAKDGPGLYIERRNNCDLHDNRTGNCQAGHATSNGGPSTTGEYWIVRTPDGQEARLGYTDASQLWTGGCPVCNTQCKWGDAKTAYQGYKGQNSGKVTRLWAADQIVDTYGNKMTFTYSKDEWVSSLTPRHIYYNYNASNVAQSHIYLQGTDSYNDGSWINALYAYNKDASGNDALVRYYVLGRITNSHRRWNGNPNWVYSSYTTLAYVQEKDAWSNVLPAQTFAYEWYNSGDYHDLQWLAYVNNGYGATTRAVYEKAGGLTGFANANGCNNYRLQSMTTMDGLGGTPLRKTYTYGSPCYDYYGSSCQSRATSLCEQCTSGNMQTLVGYDVVTEKVWDGTAEATRGEHYFYNTNPEWRLGREWRVRQFDPATSYEMARTETTYGRGSVQGTATGFGFVSQEQATIYTDNAPVATTRKSSSVDWYGNVVAEYNYGAELRVPNAGFEGLTMGTDCTQEGWSTFWTPSPAALSGAFAFAGWQSLSLSGSTTGGACQDISGLTNGVQYQVRVKVRATAGAGKFRLWLHDTSGANTQVSGDIAPPTDGSWQEVVVSYIANATGKVRIHLYYPVVGSGTIYVDEVALAKATDFGDETSAQRGYYPNTTGGKWIVGKPSYQNDYAGITLNVGGSAMKRQTINYYDGATAYTTPPAKGALTKSSVGLGSLWQTSQAAYDQWGNQTGTTDAGGHTSSTAYDTQFYLYPTSVTDASNKTATFNYDKVKGLLLSATDPNGAITSYEYDGLGRLLKIIKPYDDSSYPTTRYGYAPPQATSLYPYGDFEAGTGWTLDGDWSAGAISSWGYTAGQGLNGSKALQVNTNVYANKADGWIGQAYGSWAAGQTHMIGGWVRSPAGGWVCMSVSNGMNETTLSCVWAGSSWQYMGGQISLPAESTQMLLLFRFWTPSVTYYVDNVVMDGATPLGIMEAKLDTASGVGATMDTFSYYDGLGRVLQARAETQQQAQQSVVNVEYDGLGREKFKYAPAFEAWSWSYSRPAGWNARPRTVTAYDALGRVSQVTAPDNTVSKVFYNGFQTAAIDANNHQKISVTDGRGLVVAIKEYDGAYSTVNWNATPYATTSYTYDVMGKLTRVTDAATNQTNIGYDALGRKISMSDPDMGSWVYHYDNDRLLITQIDAKNNATNFYYDALHRRMGKVNAGIVDRATYTRPADPGYAGYTERYYYDQPGHGAGIGQMTSMSNANASTSWTYDLRGRVTQESVTVPAYLGQTYTTQYTYYSLDQVAMLTYPGSGEVIAPSYNVGARLAQVHSNDYSLNYASGLAYNPLGQLTQMTYGNNRVTTYDYYDTASELDGIANTYYSFRLKTLSVSGGLMNMTYNYDKVGNVKMRNDAGATESFGYDALDRLTSVSGPYSAGYTYTSIGNINTKTEPPSGTSSYGYDAAHKHAVTTLNGAQKFWYDANGNMTTRTEAGGAYAQTWTYNNMLDTVTVGGQTTQFLYDADGNRVMRKNADGSRTLYVGGLLEVECPALAQPANLTPANGAVVAAGTSNITWAAVSGASRYLLRIDDQTDAWGGPNDVLNDNATSPYTYNFQFGHMYHIWVHASNACGNWGAAAESYVTVTAPPTPAPEPTDIPPPTPDPCRCAGGICPEIQCLYRGLPSSLPESVSTTAASSPLTLSAPLALAAPPSGTTWRFYYSAGSTVAVREKTATTDNLYYLYGDALSSASLTTDASGGVVGQQRYYPYGDKRSDQSSGNLHTDFRFTGQRSEEATLGSLYDYGARFYSPALGRFISPDSIVPSAGNSDDFNRYSYVRNNPLKYIDPSGHDGIPVSDLPDAFQQFLKNIEGFYDWGITIQKDTLAFLMSKGFELGLPEGFMDNPNATLRYSNLDFSKAYLQSNWDNMDAKIIRAEVEMTAWRLGLLSIPEANSPSGDVLAGLNACGPAGSAFATGFTGGAALISMLAPESYHNFWTHEKGDKNGFSLKLWNPTAKKGMEVVLATDETLYYHITKAHAELESAVGIAHTVQMVAEGGPGSALQTSMNIFAGQAGGVAGWIFRADGALWNMAGRRVMQSKHVVPDGPINWSAGW